MSNKDLIKCNWTEAKVKVRNQWANLTENQLSQAKGTREELCGMIQKTYGYQKDRCEKEIDAFIKHNNFSFKDSPRA